MQNPVEPCGVFFFFFSLYLFIYFLLPTPPRMTTAQFSFAGARQLEPGFGQIFAVNRTSWGYSQGECTSGHDVQSWLCKDVNHKQPMRKRERLLAIASLC